MNVVDLKVNLDVRDVLRMMGFGREIPVRGELLDLVDRLVREARGLLKPRGVFAVYDVERMTDDELHLADCPVICGPIAEFLRPARRVAVFVVTVGDAIEQRTEERLRNDAKLEGYAFNAIGSAAADAAVDALANEVYWREAGPDEGITPPFSPGYCGMSLDEQQKIFSIVDGDLIGVRLLPTMIMQPLKSVSGLLGIGQRDAVAEHGVPCQWCDRPECKMRR